MGYKMANQLIDVATYTEAGLAMLVNSCPEIKISNGKWDTFNKIPNQLGGVATYSLPCLVDSTDTIAFGTWGSLTQLQRSISLTKQGAVPLGISNLELIYNLEGYLGAIGKSAVATLATKVGKEVADKYQYNTYFTSGDGTAAGLSSFQQLAQAVDDFNDAGMPAGEEICGIIPLTAKSRIVGTGLNQFAPDRNDEMANTWEIGEFNGVKWYTSNMCPQHVAGTCGKQGLTLTVIDINADGDELTVDTTLGVDANAIKKGDVLTFKDITGYSNLRYLTYFGGVTTSQYVQVTATANAASDASGNIVISIDPPLVSTAGRTQNINDSVEAGMQLSVLGSHRAGAIFVRKALMLGMPDLGPTDPFDSARMEDKDTGVRLREYHGFLMGDGAYGYAHDVVWGSDLVPRYSRRLAFPM